MDNRIHLYIDGELKGTEKEAFEKALSTDSVLRENYEKMLDILKLLRDQNSTLKAPEAITDKVMAAIEQGSSSNIVRQLLKIAAVILITVLAGTGIYTYLHGRNDMIRVTLNVVLPQAKTVAVLGTFNKWGEKPIMLKKAGKGLFIVTLKLKPGIYQYVYQVNGRKIISDPHARMFTDDGFGQVNAILIVRAKASSSHVS